MLNISFAPSKRNIPLEIIDMILHELAPNLGDYFPSRTPRNMQLLYNSPHPNHNIAACALVSREWCLLARRYVFRTLSATVDCEMQDPGFLTTPQIGVKTLGSLSEFLSSHSHLSTHIIHLIIHAHHIYGQPSPVQFSNTIRPLSQASLRVLELHDVVLHANSFLRNRANVLGCLGTINTLIIIYGDDDIDNASASDISNILSLFTSIDTLIMGNLYVSQDRGEEDFYILSDVRITCLQLLMVRYLRPFVPPAIRPCRNGIEHLIISDGYALDDEDMRSLERMVGASGLGKTLDQLDLNLSEYQEFFEIDLSLSTSLRTLTLTVLLPSPHTEPTFQVQTEQSIWSSLLSLFRSRSPPNLHTLYLIIDRSEQPLYLIIDHSEQPVTPLTYDLQEITDFEQVLLGLRSLQHVYLIPRYTRVNSGEQYYARGRDFVKEVGDIARYEITESGQMRDLLKSF